MKKFITSAVALVFIGSVAFAQEKAKAEKKAPKSEKKEVKAEKKDTKTEKKDTKKAEAKK